MLETEFGEITLVAETDPARIDRIRALEQRVGDAAVDRAAARGEVFRNSPTMFHGYGRQNPNVGNADRDTWVPDVPIDSIVKWARTSHGGRQFQLDLGPSDDGCMRWGLCEGHEEEEEREIRLPSHVTEDGAQEVFKLLDAVKADEVPDFLDPATPMSVVDDYLRAAGGDPQEIGDRGVEEILKALGESVERDDEKK